VGLGGLLRLAFNGWHMLSVLQRTRAQQLLVLRQRVVQRVALLALQRWSQVTALAKLQRAVAVNAPLVGRGRNGGAVVAQVSIRRDTAARLSNPSAFARQSLRQYSDARYPPLPPIPVSAVLERMPLLCLSLSEWLVALNSCRLITLIIVRALFLTIALVVGSWFPE
jgi:hypothetical protein